MTTPYSDPWEANTTTPPPADHAVTAASIVRHDSAAHLVPDLPPDPHDARPSDRDYLHWWPVGVGIYHAREDTTLVHMEDAWDMTPEEARTLAAALLSAAARADTEQASHGL